MSKEITGPLVKKLFYLDLSDKVIEKMKPVITALGGVSQT